MRKGNEMESLSGKQKMQDEINTEMISSRVNDLVQEKNKSCCNGKGLQSGVDDETLACQIFHSEVGLNGNETAVSRTGEKSECVPLGMELRVRSDEYRLNFVNKKVDAESELEGNGINKSQWQNVHEASDFVFNNVSELMNVSNQAHAASIGDELMEKSIDNVPGEKVGIAEAYKLSGSVEGEAITRDNFSGKKPAVVNGGETMLNQYPETSEYRGKELVEEIEADKEHGTPIPTEPAMSQDQSFADGATEERNSEEQGVFIHRKRNIAEADSRVGTERPKKSLKPEGFDEASANSFENEVLNEYHIQRPETTPKDIDLETSVCKEDESTAVPRVPRYKKRKIALFVAYCGVGYQGMQRNPGAVTIEGDLEEALFKAAAIAESNFGDPRKVEWMRAARTDKGVSAVGQVVSGRFFIDPPGFVERVNSHLPRQIHVLGYRRVTNTFNAKNLCDRRRYEYVLPVFAFDPSAHLNRESVMQLGGESKVSMCSENRQETEGAVINGDFKNTAQDIAELSQNIPNDAFQREPVREHSEQEPHLENGMEALDRTVPKMYLNNLSEATDVGKVMVGGTVPVYPSIRENEVQQEGYSSCQHNDDNKSGSLGATSEPVILSKEASTKASFQFCEKHLTHFNSILSHYVGTHNFHNFTSRMKAEDPSAKRYIISFEASTVFTIGSMEFVKCKVVGQSFMLHQIRKMIGLAVAIARGCAPLSMIETALRRDVKINVPMAPELGLFLDECMYHSYNQKFSSSHEPISLHDFQKDIDDFKWEQIYPHIALTEAKERVVALWLHSLNDRNYPDFVEERQKTQ